MKPGYSPLVSRSAAEIDGLAMSREMDEATRLSLIAEAVRYCQRVRALGMRPACYTKALREPVHLLWERRSGSKSKCAKFRSQNAVGLRFGKREIVYDHAVPFRYLQQALLDLSVVSETSIKDVLSRFSAVAIITTEEERLLRSAKLGNHMPADWDGVDELARYKAVGIALIENLVAEQKTSRLAEQSSTTAVAAEVFSCEAAVGTALS